MRRRIQNNLSLTCDDVDFHTVRELQFYMRQGEIFEEYVPEVISAHQLLVTIPQADVMTLDIDEPVKLQIAFREADGTPRASEIEYILVEDLLKEAGYDPL